MTSESYYINKFFEVAFAEGGRGTFIAFVSPKPPVLAAGPYTRFDGSTAVLIFEWLFESEECLDGDPSETDIVL